MSTGSKKEFKHGSKYWLNTPDGSRLLVTAIQAGDGEIDLKNEAFDWSIWAGADSYLDGFTVERYEGEEG